MIRRIPLQNATSNTPEILEGELTDFLPRDNSVYVDRQGKTYDPTRNVRVADLPTDGVIQLRKTTWH